MKNLPYALASFNSLLEGILDGDTFPSDEVKLITDLLEAYYNGWRLVPEEPTEEMLKYMSGILMKSETVGSYQGIPIYAQPSEEENYQAMLDAAPKFGEGK